MSTQQVNKNKQVKKNPNVQPKVKNPQKVQPARGKREKKNKSRRIDVISPEIELKKKKNPYVLLTPPDTTSTAASIVPIQTTMDPAALRVMLAGVVSYCLEKQLVIPGPRSSDLDFTTVWKGFNYMLEGIWSEARSGVVVLNERPRVIHDIIAALTNKECQLRGGKMGYSWNEEVPPNPLVSFSTGPTEYWTVSPTGDTPMYNSTSFANYTSGGTLNDYTTLLKYLDASNHPSLRTVKAGSWSPLKKDVSCRARSYVYCGLQSTASSGWACSSELEGPIYTTQVCRFVAYNTRFEDSRIPTQLAVTSGDPCTMIGLHLLGLAGGWDNRCCPKFIPVDFDKLCFVVCQYMVLLKNAALSSGVANNSTLATLPLNFSYQDFQIAFAQALKGMLGTTSATQFVGPLEFNSGGNQFIPFTNGGNNYANRNFAKEMQLPELLVENFNALKARGVSVPGGKHAAVYVPILGRWYQDTPAQFTFGIGAEAQQDLFTTFSPAQDSINILDGTLNNLPVDLNNGYYGEVIANWNAHIRALNPYSSPTCPLAIDSGPVGLPLILTTIEERYVPPSFDAPPIRRPLAVLDDISIKNCRPVKQEELVGKVKNVTYVPAATIAGLDVQTMYTLIPNNDGELMTLMQSLVLPSIRFNKSDPGDVLNSQMYSVHTRFPITIPLSPFGQVDTQSELTRLTKLAGFCIVGIGKDDSTTYTSLMAALRNEGLAAGIFKTLAGLVGTVFPAVAPIAGMIANAIEA